MSALAGVTRRPQALDAEEATAADHTEAAHCVPILCATAGSRAGGCGWGGGGGTRLNLLVVHYVYPYVTEDHSVQYLYITLIIMYLLR